MRNLKGYSVKHTVEDKMDKKVTVTFTEIDDPEQKQRKIEILADGFYRYLKKKGHLKKDLERDHKIEKILEDSRRICQGELDS